jgi:hypothetical protein
VVVIRELSPLLMRRHPSGLVFTGYSEISSGTPPTYLLGGQSHR